MDTFPEELEACDFALPSCSVPTPSNRDNIRVTAAPSHEEKQICTTLFLRSEQRRFVDVVHLERLGIDRRWHKFREFLHNNRRIMLSVLLPSPSASFLTLRRVFHFGKKFPRPSWLQVRVGSSLHASNLASPRCQRIVIHVALVISLLSFPAFCEANREFHRGGCSRFLPTWSADAAAWHPLRPP
ncbi:hypothetical protein FI667_g16539, partial [Globisporangium splendens]